MSQVMLFHLIELRKRILKVLVVFAGCFILLFLFANDLFQFIIGPLIKVLPEGSTVIATQVASPLITPIHLALNVAILLCTPYALFQTWMFISPGLYQEEKTPLKRFLGLGLLMFIIGAGFCFYIVLPFILKFFVNALPKGVQYFPDMNNVISFINQMIITFGLVFQLPLVCLAGVHLGWFSAKSLKLFRPYFIVSSFIIGMLLTPPDVLSQLLLALPMCLLYEIGILFSTRHENKKLTQSVLK